MIMKSSLLVVMCSCLLPSISAQSAMVRCTEAGSSNCKDAFPMSIPYSVCCSMVKAANRHYLDENGNCNRCGPILDEAFTLPTLVTGSYVTFSWKLATCSVVPPTSFTVAAKELGPYYQSSTVEGDAEQFKFENLLEGILYTYSVRALGGNGGVSPAVEVSWVTGRDLGPTFSDFVETSVSRTEVSAEWTLQSNGIRPLLNMTLTWQDDMKEGNPASRNMILSEPRPDGSKFNCTFENLSPETRYSLKIIASNGKHTTVRFFTFDTNRVDEVVIGSPLGLLSHAVSATSVSTVYLLLLTLLLQA